MATILIIDDDAAIRQFLESFLSDEGHRVLQAPDAQVGLAVAQSEHPHVIITDVVMPGMDGFEFIQQLRSTPGIAETPVIACSGTYHHDDVKSLLEIGGVRFLAKPTGPKVLLEEIERAIAASSHVASALQPDTFEREHRRVLADRLLQQVKELEAANAQLQNEVAEREFAQQQLEQSRLKLQALSRQLLEAQESERRSLARELHDEIGQALSAISINLQMISESKPEAAERRVRDSIRIVDCALAQVRELSLDLRPSILDDLGLGAALEWLVDRQKERAGWVVHLHAALPDKPRLPAVLETAFFRIAQEALTNIMRHAKAQQVWLHVKRDEQAIHLTVRDNGIGFDVDASRQRAIRGGSLGLLGMQERIELLSGEISITSERGKGTTIHASARLDC